jgi:hypothetical protein
MPQLPCRGPAEQKGIASRKECELVEGRRRSNNTMAADDWRDAEERGTRSEGVFVAAVVQLVLGAETTVEVGGGEREGWGERMLLTAESELAERGRRSTGFAAVLQRYVPMCFQLGG